MSRSAHRQSQALSSRINGRLDWLEGSLTSFSQTRRELRAAKKRYQNQTLGAWLWRCYAHILLLLPARTPDRLPPYHHCLRLLRLPLLHLMSPTHHHHTTLNITGRTVRRTLQHQRQIDSHLRLLRRPRGTTPHRSTLTSDCRPSRATQESPGQTAWLHLTRPAPAPRP